MLQHVLLTCGSTDMALETKNVAISFGGGIDTKTDQKQLQAGRLSTITNGQYDRLGALGKRYGYNKLDTSVFYSGSQGLVTGTVALPALQQLATFQDQLVGIDDWGTYIYSFVPSAKSWNRVDRISNVAPDVRVAFESTADMTNADVAYCNGFLVYTWITNAWNSTGIAIGDVQWGVLDSLTNAIIIGPTNVSGTVGRNTNPKATTVGNKVVLTYVDFSGDANGSMFASVIDCTANQAPFYVGAQRLVSGTVQSPLTYDACTDGTRLYTLHSKNENPAKASLGASGLAYNVYSVGSTLTNIASTTANPGAALYWSIGLCFKEQSGTRRLWSGFSYQETTSSIDYVDASVHDWTPNTLTAWAGPKHMWSSPQALGNQFAIYLGMVAPDPTHCYVTWRNSISDGVFGGVTQAWSHSFSNQASGSLSPLGAPRGPMHRVEMLSKPFLANVGPSGSQHAFVLGTNNSSVQGTQYLFDILTDESAAASGTLWQPVCTVAPRLSNVPSTQIVNNFGMLSNVPSGTNGYVFNSIGVALQDSTTHGKSAVNNITFDFSPFQAFDCGELGQNLHISTGIPTYFDGNDSGEIGFLRYPEMGASNLVSGSGGGLVHGTYQYAVVYEWVDSRGQRHQSAPSIEQQITVGAGDNGKVTLTIPCLSITNRQNPYISGTNPVGIAVYRSTVNGELLYRLTGDAVPIGLYNVPTTSSLMYSDTSSDGTALLSTREVLYTSVAGQGPAPLPHFNPPAAKYGHVFNNRWWLAGCDDPKAIWFSSEFVSEEAIWFNDDMTLTVDDGGAITALNHVDDKLIVFKQDRIFIVEGQAPNELGQGNQLQVFPLETDGQGCINHRSVVRTGDGCMFQSKEGIYLLDRSMSVQNVGWPTEDLQRANPLITSAVVHPVLPHVRFTCYSRLVTTVPYSTQGVTIVYDYRAKAWMPFYYYDVVNDNDNAMVSAAVPFSGTYAMAFGTGFQGDVLNYPGGSVVLEASGTFYDGGRYVPMYVETPWIAAADVGGFQRCRDIQLTGEAFDASDFNIGLAHDYDPAYVQNSTWAVTGADPGFNREVHVKNQKGQALKIKISDDDSGASTTGKGINISRIILRLGVKPGTAKNPPANRQ